MIAKRIARTKGTSSPARLVRYMVAAQGGIEPESWARTADYILDTKKTTTQGEKVATYRVTNCGTDDPAQATTIIEAMQAANTRSKANKTYHLVFSFPPGEQPPLEVLHAIEDELCAAIGFADHHRISAVHQDTDHLHVHVAISKVHPTGLQNIEPFYDKQRLMEACERLEIKHGLAHTNHGLTEGKAYARSDRSRVDRIGDMEAHAGVESLASHITRTVAPAIRAAASWQELHTAMSEHGLQIKPRGAGFVIGDARQGVWCKASDAGRDLSAKALTDRLGLYEADQSQSRSARQGYTPGPRHRHPSSVNLFTEYQRERQAAIATRRGGLAAIRSESDERRRALLHWCAAQRAIARVAARGLARRTIGATISTQANARRAEIASIAAAKRKALIGATTLPIWSDWLAARAEVGDVEALGVLRSRAERAEKVRGDLLTAERADRAKIIILDSLKAVASKNGAMSYRTADGGLVVDRASHVQASGATIGAAFVALALAADRFDGQTLDVRGSEEFRRDVAQLAGVHGIRTTFSDPLLEAIRQTGAASRGVSRAQSAPRGLTPKERTPERPRKVRKGRSAGLEL
ncbi:TraI/MobA(P) family conjugative relaxase [Sphingobium aromaticiconvertens]|uniref:TraI/MobA(P) family conjugative relaxase n=1 Tax=Sphingobium aromaticiconvertens TaxID=365341 RepID=UPI00301797D0